MNTFQATKMTLYKRVAAVLLLANASLLQTQAQTPNSFPYQAAARTANGRPLANKAITARISLRDSLANGTMVYQETHNLTTNALGLFDLRVGQGTVVTGSFSTINWGGAAKFLQTEIDTGSGNFLDMGTTQLLSVPYALYAQNSGNGVPSGGNDGQILTRCNGQLIWTTGGQCPGTITALNCASATTTGTLTSGTAASGVSSSIPYTGGNGGTHNGQTITSTGVTGLTATLTAGTLATGAGGLTYTITGTPSAAGTASFAISLGGQNCTLSLSVSAAQPTYPAGTVHCNGTPTLVVEVTNPATGRIWMDRNLGASRAATSSTDDQAYGDLYQWGRRADGHQCRTSTTTSTLSSTDQPTHGSFITINSDNEDWRSPQNNNLWQGVNGVNNPCPSGYRLPTNTELDAERASWSSNNAAGAFASPLKLPVAGYRRSGSGFGSHFAVGLGGVYWSGSVVSSWSGLLNFGSSWANMGSDIRSNGFSVRCLKD